MKICSACGREYPDEIRFCQNDGTTLRASASSDLIGSVIADRYHITKKLGEGGMGAVYLGEHVKMGRKSAIKVISQSMSQDVDAIARFNREAANAAQINHPNVCGIYDFGETPDGVIYLAMEFIEGEALTALLEREGAFSPRRAADILQQSASALQAAHDFGIVHRDLKPDNIMISQDRDGSDLVKVVDFGIAKAMGGDSEQKVTKTGLVVGTPEYMSPEQLSGDKLDGRSDIYSLGLVMFRMLTGILPFQAESSQEVMIKRLTDDPLRLSEALPGSSFPPALQQAMDKALQRMPGDRYASAAEFGRDVMDAVSGAADVAPRVDAAAATQVFDTSAQGATAQLPNTVVQGKDAPARSHSPTTPPTPMPMSLPSADKKKPIAAIAAVVAVVAAGGIGSVVFLSGGEDTPPAAVNATPSDTTTLATNRDTAQSQPVQTDDPPNTGQPNGRTSQPGANPQTTDNPANRPSTPPVTTTTTTLDPANATNQLYDWMDALVDGASANRAIAIRDSARAYYDLAGMSTDDRGLAAYVIANAYAELNDATQALQWARQASQLVPSDDSYRRLVTDLQRGGDA